jgi:hypothetical protein
MKTLLNRTNGAWRISGALLFAATLAAASFLSSCKSDPQSANGPNLPLASGGASTPAHPAVTYPSVAAVKKSNYNTVGVMDTDGTHQTNVVTAATSYETIRNTSWNYSGGSIAYRDYGSSGNATYPSSIKTTNVTVNSSGVPVGSTPATIYTLNSSDDAYVGNGLAWCSTSSTAEIAFTRQHAGGSQNGLSELCTISQSGGTPTVLASYQKTNSVGTVTSYFTSPTWSPDDSKIAVFREDTFNHVTIMIFNSSTGAATDSIPITLNNMNHLEWSRSGANILAYAQLTSSGYQIYYCAPSTGSTPSTNSVPGSFPTWSPNNSGLMYVNTASSNALMKVTAQTSSTTQILSDGPTGAWLNWKR